MLAVKGFPAGPEIPDADFKRQPMIYRLGINYVVIEDHAPLAQITRPIMKPLL